MERPEIPNTRKGRQCAKQCEIFRAQCLPRCQRTGRMPDNRSRSADCSKDCKDFESGCLRVCLGPGARPKTEPEKARLSEAPKNAAGIQAAPQNDTSDGE
jgi:hypothetical protein